MSCEMNDYPVGLNPKLTLSKTKKLSKPNPKQTASYFTSTVKAPQKRPVNALKKAV